MLLSIVILTFNTAPLTIQCIRSIKRHCTIPASDYEIIIVDNHSREEDVEKLARPHTHTYIYILLSIN